MFFFVLKYVCRARFFFYFAPFLFFAFEIVKRNRASFGHECPTAQRISLCIWINYEIFIFYIRINTVYYSSSHSLSFFDAFMKIYYWCRGLKHCRVESNMNKFLNISHLHNNWDWWYPFGYKFFYWFSLRVYKKSRIFVSMKKTTFFDAMRTVYWRTKMNLIVAFQSVSNQIFDATKKKITEPCRKSGDGIQQSSVWLHKQACAKHI